MKTRIQLTTIHRRINFLIDALNMNESTFARRTGASRATIINVISGKCDPTYALIRNIITVFPVNQKWLILGVGPTFKTDDLATVENCFIRPSVN
jgi:DNA-binding XRE family transcriptional regulator